MKLHELVEADVTDMGDFKKKRAQQAHQAELDNSPTRPEADQVRDMFSSLRKGEVELQTYNTRPLVNKISKEELEPIVRKMVPMLDTIGLDANFLDVDYNDPEISFMDDDEKLGFVIFVYGHRINMAMKRAGVEGMGTGVQLKNAIDTAVMKAVGNYATSVRRSGQMGNIAFGISPEYPHRAEHRAEIEKLQQDSRPR